MIFSDDRSEYASLHAILYGPYLLAGLSLGDHEIAPRSAESLSDWITPVPAEYSSHLISLSQETGKSRFFISNNDQKIVMATTPEAGNYSAIHATFRLLFQGTLSSSSSKNKKLSSFEDVIGSSVLLEPFDLPGMLVAHSGADNGLIVVGNEGSAAEFQILKGLDGKGGAVSLEAKSKPGCFVYSGTDYEAGEEVKLLCKSGSSGFAHGASFVLDKGQREYHPISFFAKGEKRSYVLEPILNMRDEFYNVYFEISN